MRVRVSQFAFIVRRDAAALGAGWALVSGATRFRSKSVRNPWPTFARLRQINLINKAVLFIDS
eukprot:1392908-Amorphochlora_amoeboformis.AAC.1